MNVPEQISWPYEPAVVRKRLKREAVRMHRRLGKCLLDAAPKRRFYSCRLRGSGADPWEASSGADPVED
jgi:hypothetical protein